jgi:GDP-4-dehydro-6-deoxy-D-mannose reductase
MPYPVLVTGASGFAGSHLVDHLAARHVSVVGWSRADVDLLDRDRVRAMLRELRPARIYHCAGAPHVADSWNDTNRPLTLNVLATHYLLDAARRCGVPCRVLIPGSATVYRASSEPISEDAPLEPTSPYALSKLAQEQLGARAPIEDGIEVILTRSFNHIGPRQSAAFAAASMARQLAMIEAGQTQPVLRVGKLDTRRDLTDVRDTVRAYVLLMQHGRVGVPYNVCSGIAHAIREVLDGLRARVNVQVDIELDTSRLRPNDTPVVCGNPGRLQAETGWAPEISFDRMLDDLLDYWREVVRSGSAVKPVA